MERLRIYYKATGRKLTLLGAVSEACGALEKAGADNLGEMANRYLATVATVKRKDLAEAVKEFSDGREHLGKASNGDRSKRSPVYLYNTSMWLREFASTFPGYAVCDLTKDSLNAYISKPELKELSSKSRNDRRNIVKQFLRWCVAKDYLSQQHRLFEAVDFKAEDKDSVRIEFYQPKELKRMLNNADADLLPVIALGGLAGLRREEIMRLEWADVWKVKGKVEIGEKIAKGRKRRLVDIVPALKAWLRAYRKASGPVWSKSPDALEEAFMALREGLGIAPRRNGLRHSFITFHMAEHCNENLTAAEAGNSPQMIHEHYRGLATKAEARRWFSVRPEKAGNVVNLPEQAMGD